jgi:hypothetical protein
MRTKKPVLQLRSVNKTLEEMGRKGELVKGDGYFYFIGDAVEYAESTSVFVFKLNDLTMLEWVKEFDTIAENSRQRKPE